MINKTVLIVERDPKEAETILTFFREHNFSNRIEIVHTKQEALDFIFETGIYSKRENHETPGLILLDLLTNMTPDIKILKPLQSYLRTQNIPIIILTSSKEQERQLGEYGLEGAIGFIRKPLSITSFIETIQHMGSDCKGTEKIKRR